MAEIRVFVQTQMPGLTFGEIVTLEHTPFVDALIAGGRLIAESDPIFEAMVASTTEQPEAWDLLDTATAAASPEVPVTPATAALNVAPEPVPVAVNEAPAAPPAEAPAEVPTEAPVTPAEPDPAV